MKDNLQRGNPDTTSHRKTTKLKEYRATSKIYISNTLPGRTIDNYKIICKNSIASSKSRNSPPFPLLFKKNRHNIWKKLKSNPEQWRSSSILYNHGVPTTIPLKSTLNNTSEKPHSINLPSNFTQTRNLPPFAIHGTTKLMNFNEYKTNFPESNKSVEENIPHSLKIPTYKNTNNTISGSKKLMKTDLP